MNRNEGTLLDAASPYTIKNLDDAIAHLEAAIGADHRKSLFGPRYWYSRVLQVGSTPGIMQAQSRRLKRLLDRLVHTDQSKNGRMSRAR
ncbi:hypothetical protein [Paraburkholderia domus]|uniref:hypothetical protein n=1 Tax=Paraburkholderia domus TaxID=2793075 RepID=UPI0019115A72|nr:hypothetical protein [Paraburkholderia domus]MBK5169458.1 hypothetical protein [Burkholderia sp. R-70211]